MLSRDDILQVQDLKSRDVAVPEWGGDVRVRMLTGAERDRLMACMVDQTPESMSVFRFRLVASVLVDENNQRIFQDDEAPLLMGKSAAAIERVFAAATDLNKLGPAVVEAAEGNSGGAPNAASS